MKRIFKTLFTPPGGLSVHAAAAYTAAVLFLSALFVLFAYQPPDVNIILKIAVGVLLFITAYVILSVLSRTILCHETPLACSYIKKRRFFIYALPCAAVWLLYLIAFYPGLMTYDSIVQWGQIISGNFGDWHPVMHTWFMLAVTRLWFSPAMVALSQIAILSSIFGYGMYSLEKAGVGRRVLYIVTALFAVSPVNGMMSVTLWKDVLFSAAILLFTVIAMNITVSGGKWLDSVPNLILFAVASLSMLFFRHNGIYCFIPTALLLIVLFRKRIVRITILCAVILAVYFLVNGPVFNALHVKRAFEGEAYSVPLNVMAAVVSNGDHFTNGQLAELSALMPISKWKSTYNPFIADPIKNAVDYDVLLADKASFFKLLWDISIQNPKSALVGTVKLTSLVWRIPEYKGAYTATPPTGISGNTLGLQSASLCPALKNGLTGFYSFSVFCLKALLWRPALPLYLMLLFGILALYRHGKKALIVCSAAFFNNLSVMIALPAQDFRYLYANMLVVLPVMAFALAGKKAGDKKAPAED